MFSRLFPTFEKPVERPRYLNVEPGHHDFSSVATVLVLAAACGVALALWEPSIRTTPFTTASVRPAAEATVAAAPQAAPQAMTQETTAAAEVEDDQPAPTVKTSTLCAQRTSARRDCAQVKAIKDARLTAPDPIPAPAPAPTPTPAAKVSAKSAPVAQAEPAAAPQPASAVVQTVAMEQPQTAAPKPVPPSETAAAPSAHDTPAAKSQRTAKKSKPRVQEEPPVERLVRVYDQVMPDGRRVPVYRRANGRYEVGSVIDGEYRSSARRADMYAPRTFGLQ
jgi:hypothetical protein